MDHLAYNAITLLPMALKDLENSFYSIYTMNLTAATTTLLSLAFKNLENSLYSVKTIDIKTA